METLTEVIPTSSVEEDLEAFLRATWEVGVWADDGSDFGERHTIAPPSSLNRVSWSIDRDVILLGWRLWCDGECLPDRFFRPPLRFRQGDNLHLTLSLSMGC